MPLCRSAFLSLRLSPLRAIVRRSSPPTSLSPPLCHVLFTPPRPDTLLAQCFDAASSGSQCTTSLQVSYDYGHTFVQAIRSVAQYDWGPGENTVMYSAFDDAGETIMAHMAKGVGVYRSSDAFLKSSNTYLVVERGAGFKVRPSQDCGC